MSNLRRRRAFREPRLRLEVFCEGKRTERGYLASCCTLFRNILVNVRVVDCGLDPRELVRRAVAHRKDLARVARKSTDSTDSMFEVWAIFDVDEHRWFNDAVVHARDAGVLTATSNPCFEIWAIYHFEDHHAPIDRAFCCKKLADLCTDYSSANKRFTVDNCGRDREAQKKAVESAIERGRWGIGQREAEGIPNGNPSSRMFELVEKIVGR